jgi:flavin reductase (DIM6/NTAB) family NADH-FMN oxidoreductase RutF
MPTSEGPVGPFPEGVESDDQRDDYDRLRRRVFWTMPSGLYVVGSRHAEQRNAMTLNWATQIASAPKLVGIAVEKEALTHALIAGGGAFSLCVVDREDRAIVRKFTKPVEVDMAAMTMNGFPFRDGRTGAPVLTQAVAYLDCEVRQRVDAGSHTFFAGEVVDAGFQKPEDTLVLRMEDTRMNYGG